MASTERGTGLFQRGLIGFWFCGIGALGFVRFFMRAFRDQRFEADAIGWLWLAGAVIVTFTGLVVIVRAARGGPPATDRD